MNTTEPGFLRLLQLSSASLPVGAYAFSHGLEYAVEAGWVKSPDAICEWLTVQLHHCLARVDVPLLYRMGEALREDNTAAFIYWNDFALACRETHELELSDSAPGESLQRLLPQLGIPAFPGSGRVSFITGFSQAASHWKLDSDLSALGYVWSWLENQVIAASKLMPIGQSQVQIMLGTLQEEVPAVIACGRALEDEQLGASLPALTIASMLHETQYSRLFRS